MSSFQCYGWNEHSLLTSIVLKNDTVISQQAIVPAESGLHFLQQEKTGLIKVLRNIEFWSRDSIENYKPLPEALFFQAGNTVDLQTQFTHAIRINPKYPLTKFVQYLTGQTHRIQHQALQNNQVMLKEAADSSWISILNPP